MALAGLLPCFWIYAEVGRDIHARSMPGNPYQAWIDTYAGDEFHAIVRGVIATIDRVADAADSATHQRMAEAYRYSAELEWMFWDSAYQLGGWPTRP
ncbi:Thiaminase-2 [compost metagenome]